MVSICCLISIACNQPDQGVDKWLQSLESSQWLKHIKTIMEATHLIIRTMHEENGHVLIHCSDGWDRTAQLSALTQLCLDPYYRTIEGFMVLVEKEWVGFGHKFNDRCGFLSAHPVKISSSSHSSSSSALGSTSTPAFSVLTASNGNLTVNSPSSSGGPNVAATSSAQRSSKDEKETSPVFLQFLEATQLLVRAYPSAFEFNQYMLTDLFSALQSCQYGTFLMNNEHDRAEKRIREKCQSYWSAILDQRPSYTNPYFRMEAASIVPLLWPPVESKNIPFWLGMYCRYDPPVLVPSALHISASEQAEGTRSTDSAVETGPSLALPTQPYSRKQSAQSHYFPYSNHDDLEAYAGQLMEVLEVSRAAAKYWKERRSETIRAGDDPPRRTEQQEKHLRRRAVYRSRPEDAYQWTVGNLRVNRRHLTWERRGACGRCHALCPPSDRMYGCWRCGESICFACSAVAAQFWSSSATETPTIGITAASTAPSSSSSSSAFVRLCDHCLKAESQSAMST